MLNFVLECQNLNIIQYCVVKNLPYNTVGQKKTNSQYYETKNPTVQYCGAKKNRPYNTVGQKNLGEECEQFFANFYESRGAQRSI